MRQFAIRQRKTPDVLYATLTDGQYLIHRYLPCLREAELW
jgi:hypothetical protein